MTAFADLPLIASVLGLAALLAAAPRPKRIPVRLRRRKR